jgi:hypothetical protein
MANLITPAEFATYRNISKKIDEDKVNESIGLAQQSDLVQILGDFYFDVVKNADEAEYEGLMNGSEFEYNGDEFEHAGIKKMLGDYTYSRFVYMVNINPTPFGFQKKYTEDSDGIDRNTIKDLAKQAQVDAGIKFKFIEKYILSEPTLFDRYCKNKNQGTDFFTQKFSKL